MKLQDSWDGGGAENFSEEGGKEDVFQNQEPQTFQIEQTSLFL